MSELIRISKVCKLLGTTSRTLRYYEEQGIVNSTNVSGNIQRQYTIEQIAHIKNVFLLRSLGLSISSIKELLQENVILTTIIKEKRAFVLAQIETKAQELRLLEEALCVIDSGGDIFTINTELPYNNTETIISDIAVKCTNFLLLNDLNACYDYFTVKLTEYMPISVLEEVWADTIEPLGIYLGTEKIMVAENIVFHFLRYEKLGLKIKYVFHNGNISGLWVDYYEKI